MDEKKLKKLEEMMKLLNESLTKEEFIKSFETVIKLVETLKKSNGKEFDLMHKNFSLMSEKMKNDTNSDVAEKKKEMLDYCHAEMEKMYKEHEKMMAMMDKKMAEVKDGKDADEEKIIAEVVSKIKIPNIEELEKDLPKLGEPIRDGLELLKEGEKLSIQAIQDLSKIIEEMKKDVATAGSKTGASLISKRIRFIDDLTPAGAINGVNTVFTISKSPETGSLKVYVNGQRMRVTTDYTLSGGDKTITFVTAPPTDSTILVDFRY